MERVNLWAIYYLGARLHPLSEIEYQEGNVGTVFVEAANAEEVLEQFLSMESAPRGVSKDACDRLLSLVRKEIIPLTETLQEFREHLAKPLERRVVERITAAVKEVETLMANEFPRLDVYSVLPKGIYSTPALIDRAEVALSEEVRSAISNEAKRDLNQAGRCLALELSTAAGFHAMRATERVQREYYSDLVGKPASHLNMKQCTDELRKAGGDPKVLAILDQIRDLHRNPIDHPDIFLDMTEAQELFDIAKSSISAMGRQIAKLKPLQAPAPALTGVVPPLPLPPSP
jgi:hypothetical protein